MNGRHLCAWCAPRSLLLQTLLRQYHYLNELDMLYQWCLPTDAYFDTLTHIDKDRYAALAPGYLVYQADPKKIEELKAKLDEIRNDARFWIERSGDECSHDEPPQP